MEKQDFWIIFFMGLTTLLISIYISYLLWDIYIAIENCKEMGYKGLQIPGWREQLFHIKTKYNCI